MPEVALRSVTKRYPDGSVAVDGINLTIGDGELVALIGPSGSGKTTILRLIAGLEHPTAGEITFDGRSVVEVAPERRGVALVAQPEGLYPHLDVRDNLAFPLRAAGRERATARSRVEREAGRMGLRRLLDLLPGGLSAGLRGLVATGRAFMRGAPVLLLDEPLAQADA
ncbi:MAG: ATP-binding cassette domain-containing protein, partial [Acidimicrobiia bacterium]